MLPGGCLSASSLRVTIPESGKPYEQIQMSARPHSRVKRYENTYICNALGHDHDIWLQTWRNGLNSKVCTASSESALHLIYDEHNALSVADLLQAFQEVLVGGDVATFSSASIR